MNRAALWLTRLAAAFVALAAANAHAGGPMWICNDGAKTPVFYSPATVNLNYDLGNLGPRTKAQADAIVTNSVALWTNVPTATITIGRGADLPVDVTTLNYAPYLANSGDGINPVIYDTDGSITDDLFGLGAKNSILGFAGSSYYLAPTCRYAEGRAVINGFFGVTDTTMGMVIAHEIGHLIGLDHTQLDSAQGLASSNYPLMYPIAYRNVLTLHEDDVAAVSALYPDATVNSVYGQVSGVFVLADGTTPVRGANLWATETTTNKVYSIVSDYRTQNTGFFKLLLPPGNYQLRAGAINTGFTGGSSVGPYSEVYPTDPSFQPPMYVSGVPMATLTLGNGSPLSITITAGCAATVTFRFDGTGSVADCAPPPPPPPPTLFRAYLAPNGVDSNPCTLAAPCRLLPAALAAVIDGGEVWMLASANYNIGPVYVDKSVTILAVPGALGSVVALGGNAINIATAGVKVALRNLVIVPFAGGGGTGGINMTAGASLRVETCLVANLPGVGISVNANGASVLVTDTVIRGNGDSGLYVADGARATVSRVTISGNGYVGVFAVGGLAGSTTTADIADSTIDANVYGVGALSSVASALVKVSVRDSQLVRNTNVGAIAQSNLGASATLSVSNNIIANNLTGIYTGTAGANVWASRNTISDNGTGLFSSGSGLLQSAGDNAVRNNGTDASGVISLSPGM
jgi:hypothetical protein